MANYIANSLSINMLSVEDYTLLRIKKVIPSEVPADVKSVIGHSDTARVVSGILGFEVPCNRANLVLEENDILYVAQYKGPRLPEGATTLPEGATIEFLEVSTRPHCCQSCMAQQCNTCGNMCWIQGWKI